MSENLGIGAQAFPLPKNQYDIEFQNILQDVLARIDGALDSLNRPMIKTVTADYNALSTDHTILANATGGDVDVTLPVASTIKGQIFIVKKIDSSGNAVNVSGDGGTISLTTQYDRAAVQSDGTDFWRID